MNDLTVLPVRAKVKSRVRLAIEGQEMINGPDKGGVDDRATGTTVRALPAEKGFLFPGQNRMRGIGHPAR